MAIGVAGVAFVVRTLVHRWDEVTDAFSRADATPLAGSLLLGLAAMTIIGALWVRMLQSRGHHAPHMRAMSWYYVGQLGKYVPGGIWPIVGRAELAVRGGIPRGDAYRATGMSLMTTYAAATVAIALGALSSTSYLPVGGAVVTGLGTVWFVLGSAQVTDKVSALVLRVTKRTVTFPDRRRFFVLTAAHVPSWLLMSLSTSVTAHAFGATISPLRMLFITSLSWLAGFVVVGVPGGIGVRESIFTALAGSTVGTPVAVSLALVSRVVFIAVDIVGAALSSAVATASRATSAER